MLFRSILKEKYPALKAKRNIPENKLREHWNKYLREQEIYSKTKEKFVDSRGKLRELKEEIQRVCISPAIKESEECKKTKEETRIEAKEHLLNFANRLISMLTKIKERLSSNIDLTEDEVSKAEDQIDAFLKEIEAVKSEIESFNGGTPKEKFIEVKQRLQTLGNKIKETLKKHNQRHLFVRINFMLAKLKAFGEKLENTLNRLEADGKDTTKAKTLLERYKTTITAAEDHLKGAEEAWHAKNNQKAQENFKKAIIKVKEARDILKEIHAIIKDLLGPGEKIDLKVVERPEIIRPQKITELSPAIE